MLGTFTPGGSYSTLTISSAGLDSAAEFIRLPKAEQRRLIPMLYDNDLSIPQIARLTGIAKSNIARYLG